ncbi:response regulator [Pararhodobacter aggregans]|uniref:response regulator n=1 Tax=Pararhodobacter aggregans TaxID=404875 RepID=UPI003A934CB2
MRRALTHLLDGWGVNILDVPDPAEALALIEEIGLPPDFVLIDARAGDEEAGLALMQDLARRHGPLPARLLTATRAEPLRLRALRAGVPLLYKPLDTGLLQRYVASAARRD